MNAQLFNTHNDLLAGSAWDWSAYYARESSIERSIFAKSARN
ncbi:hypothetical protein [Actinobacillus lignieresii]|nr:hypothetical protein [Actinobacillus lignieresii]